MQWTHRLKQELKTSASAFFVTLTYSDENLPIVAKDYVGYPTLKIRHLQLFIKKLRKRNSEKIRYYAVGEYGTKTRRPHYHIILFNVDSEIINRLEDVWEYGHYHIGTVTEATLHYVTKYHVNKGNYVPDIGCEKEFTTMSKRPGLGSDYINNNKKWHQENNFFL